MSSGRFFIAIAFGILAGYFGSLALGIIAYLLAVITYKLDDLAHTLLHIADRGDIRS